MAKKFFFCIIIFLLSVNLFAADIKTNILDDRAEITLSFAKGYSAFNMLDVESSNMLIFTFDSSENIKLDRQDFFDKPIKSIYFTQDNFKKRLTIEFKTAIINPTINKDDKKISIIFPFANLNNLNIPKKEPTPVPQAGNVTVSTGATYAKMIFSLTVVLIIIFVLFWLLKIFFKKQVFSDIPGSGRLLGKVDLELRKSLYFYEIGDTIYIIGVTDNGMNVIDKITDDVEATKIRSGFIKKHDFKGYMSFFKNKNALNEEISNSNAIVEEKLNSLRNRKAK